MKKSRTTVIVTFLATLLAIPVASAAINLKKKPAASITQTSLTQFSVSGVFTGLGDAADDVEIVVIGSGSAQLVCTTPNAKKKQPPGQQVPAEGTGSQPGDQLVADNGNFLFNVPITAEFNASCKGGGLDANATVTFTEVDILVVEGNVELASFHCDGFSTEVGQTETMNCRAT